MSNAALQEHYLFVGDQVVSRLAQLIPDIPVEGVEELSQVIDAQDNRQRVAYVIWGGDRFPTGDTARVGSAQLMYQRWIVWLKVRNASQVDKAARNREAGRWLGRVHKTLIGWTPTDAVRPLQRAQGPAPNYQPTSALYPLAFEIQLSL